MATEAQNYANRPNAPKLVRLRRFENPTLAHFRHFSSLFTNFSSTYVERPLQISSFMQNKPNFQKAQMNVSRVSTRGYEDKTLGQRGKNKPKTKPIQTQSNPIKANKMPKQTQYKPKTNPISKATICCRGNNRERYGNASSSNYV